MKPVELDPQAARELRDAARWYEREERGLGAQFVLAIDEAVSRAARLGADCRPAPMLPADLGVKRVLCRRFPYVLYLIELEATIRVLAVAHERRRTGYWASRLPR